MLLIFTYDSFDIYICWQYMFFLYICWQCVFLNAIFQMVLSYDLTF